MKQAAMSRLTAVHARPGVGQGAAPPAGCPELNDVSMRVQPGVGGESRKIDHWSTRGLSLQLISPAQGVNPIKPQHPVEVPYIDDKVMYADDHLLCSQYSSRVIIRHLPEAAQNTRSTW
jgi:hypothetical protein